MAKVKRYAIPITEVREVVVGWRIACEVCGEEFEAKRNDARFCSDTCRQNAHRAKRAKTRKQKAS